MTETLQKARFQPPIDIDPVSEFQIEVEKTHHRHPAISTNVLQQSSTYFWTPTQSMDMRGGLPMSELNSQVQVV